MDLFYQPLIPDGISYLDTDESKHCVKVLRKDKGDTIRLTDGKGFFYEALISAADAHQCDFKIIAKVPAEKRNYNVHIGISPTKNTERLEWFLEKAVEIGIDQISFMACKNTERPYLKLDRLEKVAISAMKQSIKATLPKLQGLLPFSELIKQTNEAEKFIAYVDSTNPNDLKSLANPESTYLVLIGPEGDFSMDELTVAIENKFKKVSLGPSRLRTETAGVVACHILNLINQ